MAHRLRPLNEVTFTYHAREFMLFYDKHRSLCDEISGMKKRRLIEDGVPNDIEITKNNFILAIKNLSGYVENFMYALPDSAKKKEMRKRIYDLEEKFTNDIDYENMLKSETSMRLDKKIILNKKYLEYVIECYDVANTMSFYLQQSLMTHTSDIKSLLAYKDTQAFYNNLADYRGEMTTDLAYFRFENLFKHFKKTLGFYYTYKMFIDQEMDVQINEMLKKAKDYVLNIKIMEIVIRMRNKSQTDIDLIYVKEKGHLIRRLFQEVFYLSTKSLSEKNIIPKVKHIVLIDKTLI